MKINFFQGDFGVNLEITPETIYEMTELIKAMKNIRSGSPNIMFLLGEKPSLNIWLQKISKAKQTTTLRK